MEDDNLLDEEILVQETQDVSPTEFSRNLINRLDFSSQQHGTETVSLDNGNNGFRGARGATAPLAPPKSATEYLTHQYFSVKNIEQSNKPFNFILETT